MCEQKQKDKKKRNGHRQPHLLQLTFPQNYFLPRGEQFLRARKHGLNSTDFHWTVHLVCHGEKTKWPEVRAIRCWLVSLRKRLGRNLIRRLVVSFRKVRSIKNNEI